MAAPMEEAAAPDYELAEQYTRVFRVGALGLGWRRLLGPPDLSLAVEEAEEADAAVAAALGCAPGTAAELRAVCSIDMLMPSKKEEDPDIIPEDNSLRTLRIRKKVLERREETIIVDRACRQETLTYEMGVFSLDLLEKEETVTEKYPPAFSQLGCVLNTKQDGNESHAIGKRPDNTTDLIEEGELLLTLNIFYPVIFQKHKDHKPYQTVLVLGSQKLTELRDSISCVNDLQIGGEFSSQPDQAPEHISKDLYKSAFFYFEGIFYNDKRYPECRDLSRTIMEWSDSHDRGYENLQSFKMEDYVFNDLSLKIGFPYLYCHQGDCEHIIIITDIRLIHHDDCLDRNLYPLLVKKHWLCTRKCFVCKMYTARWVTNRDSLAPGDPCFFCDVCFRMLHYDAEGNKLGEFLAYPYVDPGIFN